jgi:hypothetical protein
MRNDGRGKKKNKRSDVKVYFDNGITFFNQVNQTIKLENYCKAGDFFRKMTSLHEQAKSLRYWVLLSPMEMRSVRKKINTRINEFLYNEANLKKGFKLSDRRR